MAFLLILVVSFISVYAGLVSARRIGSDRFGGRVTGLDFGTLGSNFLPSGDFVFRDIVSLVFPCFVGIYSGVNNMQQLRDPLRAIPKGMFSAIALSTTLYILLVVLLGASIQRDELLQNLIIEALVAWPTKWITIPGVLMVGLGAALQCMIISSNVLQSLASTDLFTYGRHLRLHRKWGDEPIPALVFTVALSYPFIFIVDLEKLAEVTTMCFLLCYGFTNFACFLMSAFKSPNWRPRYRKYHWLLSLTGMFLCVSLMFQIRWWAALAAIAVSSVNCFFRFCFRSLTPAFPQLICRRCALGALRCFCWHTDLV
jgi:amino acid transporter